MQRKAAGFTMIELLVSTAIAMTIAGLATTAFLQLRKAIQRAEVQMALNDEAQAIYMAMQASFACAQQSCAVVAYSEPRSSPAPPPELASTDTGVISLVFMSARENKDNYQYGSTSGDANYKRWQTWDRSQMCWEMWRWQRGTRTLHAARSSLMRRSIYDQDTRYFKIAKARDLPAAPAAPFYPHLPAGSGGVGYEDAEFRTGVQPRRYLDPSHPFGGPDTTDRTVSRLDDNMWFPDTAAPGYPDPDPVTRVTKSRLDDNGTYKITEDVGDYSDLQRATRTPTFAQVSDLAWELVPHDESLAVLRIEDAISATPAAPIVLQGVWLDGRLGSGATASLKPPQVFTGSDAARRPKLLRTRFTLTDASTGVSQTFSFSFAWPGLAPKQ